MDPKLLKTFKTVCSTGSVANAANALGITQPAVSKRIVSLETSLSTALFHRIGVKLTLTTAGKKLLPIAEEILSLIASRKNEILEMDSRIAGDLNIACSHHIALYRLPLYLQQFNQAHHEVNLHFTFTESENAYNLIQSGNVDLAFLTLPANISSSLNTEILWPDEMKIMVAKSHQIFKKNADISLKQLLKYPAVLPEKATFTMRSLETALRHKTISTLPGLNANNMETIRMLIETGLGWGVLPLTMCRSSMLIIETPQLKISRNLGYAIHNNRKPNAAASAFIKLLQHPGEVT